MNYNHLFSLLTHSSTMTSCVTTSSHFPTPFWTCNIICKPNVISVKNVPKHNTKFVTLMLDSPKFDNLFVRSALIWTTKFMVWRIYNVLILGHWSQKTQSLWTHSYKFKVSPKDMDIIICHGPLGLMEQTLSRTINP